MLPIDLTLDGSTGVTLLSNIFIDHYMKDANDVQIKVYLYLLRTVSSGRAADLNTLADFLNCPERDIIRALRYWANKGVLSLSYDRARMVSGNDFYEGHLSGICLQNLQQPMSAASMITVSAPAAFAENSNAAMQQIYPAAPQNTSVSVSVSDPRPSAPAAGVVSLPDPDACKASYTLDDLKRFKSAPDHMFLLTAAQQYLGAPLSEPQFRSLLFITEGLGFSAELTDYLLQYCIGNRQKSFHYIEATALAWAEQGITTVEEAKAKLHPKEDRESTAIMNWLGRTGTPAPEEARLIHRWLRIYGFSTELIEEACKRTVLAVSTNRFPYAESILKSWHEKGIRTPEDVAAADEAYQAYRQSAAPRSSASGNGNTNPANRKRSSYTDIDQRDYDFAELEKKLINN
ncbi:MAG: DnaD domain protein [Lachnospiraceae bacterium]|nr:DnaD domain protein [Lachnospiraceae bacterium]